jgi:CHRD domain-containing protein
MSLKRTILVLGVAVVLVSLGSSGVAQTQERYKVRLATVPMDGGMRATVAGIGSASAMLAGTKLTINGTFEGLRSPATTARIHKGIAMGVRGSPIADLTVSKAPNGMVTGNVDLTPEQVQSLKKGQLYIQISSEKAPDGNLWGWLVR